MTIAEGMIRKGEFGPARMVLESLLEAEPGHPGARRLLGSIRTQLQQARRQLEAALLRDPGHTEAHHMLRKVSILQGDWSLIRKDWERDLLQFTGSTRQYNQAHLHLLFGEFEPGWSLYESRFLEEGFRGARRSPMPGWDGGPFPGRTLLLRWEQGFGDTLMFIRYAAQAKALGGRVLVAAQRELADLVATCPGVDQVLPDGVPFPPHDLQLALLSLPKVLGTTLGSIPADIPYLDVPEQVPNRGGIARALAPSHGRTRIGIVWAGSPSHARDGERSLPAEALAPLGSLGGVAWHSFQIGREETPPLPDLVSLGPLLGNFSDTAYALSGMNLVISADTATAHLSAALGVPTLLLLPFQPDFRWLLDRADSPWYPTMRLYRQSLPGDWGSVIRRLRRDLG